MERLRKIYFHKKRFWILSFLVVLTVLIYSFGRSYIKEVSTSESFKIIPEYQRFMRKIFISLGTKDTTLELHADLLDRLPDYTEIIILLPKRSMNTITNQLRDQPYGQKTKLIGFDTNPLEEGRAYLIFPERDKLVDTGPLKGSAIPKGSFWAQDLFEVAKKPDGQTLLLISDLYKWFRTYDNDSSLKVISDNHFLENLTTIGMEVRRLPLTFKGGNILIDKIEGRRIAFCGGDVFRLTRTVWKSSRDSMPTDSKITTLLKQWLNVDQVVVIGKDTVQPAKLFHLDQAIIFLSNGIAGVTNIVGEEITDRKEITEAKRFLLELKSILSQLGYRLVNIDTSLYNALNYQYYVNGIPYIDAKTKQKTYLMPIFPSNAGEFEQALVKKNTVLFESLGYQVIPVPSEVDKINGGLHCMVNVLE